ncbi:MAG: RNA polymerase sigma-70 factor [Mangrovibacterium sp.]
MALNEDEGEWTLKSGDNHIQLFKAASRGYEKALEQLYMLYFPRLYTFSLRITGDEDAANDVVQDVFIRFWETGGPDNFLHPGAFLYQMVRNASLNHLRHQKMLVRHHERLREQLLGEELYFLDMVGDEPYQLIEKDLQERVAEVMEALPDRCRQVFRLSRMDGLKNKEIAEQLDISLKAVEKHIAKALRIYRKHFAGLLSFSSFLFLCKL